jgi:hypothetical protein
VLASLFVEHKSIFFFLIKTPPPFFYRMALGALDKRSEGEDFAIIFGLPVRDQK